MPRAAASKRVRIADPADESVVAAQPSGDPRHFWLNAFTAVRGETERRAAPLSAEVSERVRALSIAAFKVLNCVGMARVDLFLADHGRLLVNEINTIPGFTNISMFPLL